MKKRILTLLLVSVLLLTMTATLLASCKKDEDPDDSPIPPDYAPPSQEGGAEDIGDDDEEKLEVKDEGGAVGLTYSDQITIDKSDKKATFRFDNPSRSHNNIVVQLLIGEMVVFETGTIAPGKRVTSMDVKDAVLEQLMPTVTYTTDTKFRVYFYDPNTNERAMVDTKLPVSVTVQP